MPVEHTACKWCTYSIISLAYRSMGLIARANHSMGTRANKDCCINTKGCLVTVAGQLGACDG